MSICIFYLLLIQEEAILIRLKQSDTQIAIRTPRENGRLRLSEQKKRNHCCLVVSSDSIKCLDIVCFEVDNCTEAT